MDHKAFIFLLSVATLALAKTHPRYNELSNMGQNLFWLTYFFGLGGIYYGVHYFFRWMGW